MSDLENNQIKIYTDHVMRGLKWLILCIFASEVIQFLSIKLFDISSDSFFMYSRWIPNIRYALRHIIGGTGLPTLEYCIIMFFYKKFPKYYQWIACVFIEVLAVHYSFIHWGFTFLSMFNIFPIILCCPYKKVVRKTAIAAAFIATIVYCIYQSLVAPSIYHLFILTVNLAAEILAYIICDNVNDSFTKLIKSNIILNRDAYKDKLTGLLNKNAFLNDKNKIIGKSIAFIDIDDFKKINDTYNHDMGDNILKMLAKEISNIDNSTTYRFGGDEFVMFSHNNTNILREQLQNAVKKLYDDCMNKYKIPVTLSIGITPFLSSVGVDDLLKKSDELLYRAKKAGKNTIFMDRRNS